MTPASFSIRSQLRHFGLDRVFIFTTAVLTVICHCFIIITLNTFNPVLNNKIHYFIYKRRIPYQIAEMTDLFHPVLTVVS
jgi:hypothetical protein